MPWDAQQKIIYCERGPYLPDRVVSAQESPTDLNLLYLFQWWLTEWNWSQCRYSTRVVYLQQKLNQYFEFPVLSHSNPKVCFYKQVASASASASSSLKASQNRTSIVFWPFGNTLQYEFVWTQSKSQYHCIGGWVGVGWGRGQEQRGQLSQLQFAPLNIKNQVRPQARGGWVSWQTTWKSTLCTDLRAVLEAVPKPTTFISIKNPLC